MIRALEIVAVGLFVWVAASLVALLCSAAIKLTVLLLWGDAMAFGLMPIHSLVSLISFLTMSIGSWLISFYICGEL